MFKCYQEIKIKIIVLKIYLLIQSWINLQIISVITSSLYALKRSPQVFWADGLPFMREDNYRLSWGLVYNRK